MPFTGNDSILIGIDLARPTQSSHVESMVFGPSDVNQNEFPAVYAPLGNGWVGYLGDVNGEDPSSEVVLAMCQIE